MKNDNLIEKNNQLREKLNIKNKQYYEDLLTYVRGKSMFRKERDVEQILLDILYDLIDAQNNGQTAENYFGKKPKILADEILRTLPNSFIEAVKLAVYVLFAYILFFTIPSMLIPSANFDFGKLIIFGVLIFIFSMGILWLIGQSTYVTNKLQKILFIFSIVAFMVLVAGFVLIK